jgi:hypothetical protein
VTNPRFTRDQPPELVREITEAIDRIAPGRGDQIYWSAVERWEDSLRRSKHQLPLPLHLDRAPDALT